MEYWIVKKKMVKHQPELIMEGKGLFSELYYSK